MDFEEGKEILGVEDTVLITSHAYAKTQEAYDALRDKLEKAGYVIPDHAQPKEGEPEKDYEFFSLEGIHAAECGSCESTISRTGVAVHNHQCECCGEPTTLEYVKDGAIRFQFMHVEEKPDGTRFRNHIGNPIHFKIYDYREPEEGDWNELVLHAKPLIDEYYNAEIGFHLRVDGWHVNSEAEAQNVLEEAKQHGLYKRSAVIDPETGQDVPVIIVKMHKSRMLTPESTFDTHEIYGRQKNYRDIKILNGEKYDYWDRNFPLPDSLHLSSKYMDGKKHDMGEDNIHEVIMSAAGQVSRADYYYQDGRAAFGQEAFKRMSNFVKHFVDVPFEEWQAFLDGLSNKAKPARHRLSGHFGEVMIIEGASSHYSQIDGPGFIYALAEWAGNMSDGKRKPVKDGPNIGNALMGIHKMANGEKLSDAEAVAMIDGAETDMANAFAESLIETAIEKDKAKRRQRKWTGKSGGEYSDPDPYDF